MGLASGQAALSVGERVIRRAGWTGMLAALLTVGLITYGAWVRASGSGLGCPDWPLCHGVVVPELERHTAIEFGHRVFAGVTVLVMTAATVLAFQGRHVAPSTFRLLLIALGAVVVQAGLGGVTVLTELHGTAVVAHLALAMTTLALLMAGTLSALGIGRGNGPGVGLATLLLVSGAVVVLAGAVLVGTGYSAACPSLPLCDSRTAFGPALLHTVHRAAVVLLVLALAATTIRLRQRRATPFFVAVNHGVSLVMVLQVVVGLLSVWRTFPEGLQVLHVGLAALVWWGLASSWAATLLCRRA